ncbi:MAG TPA: hypothetical protein PLQ27_01235 [Candidatus Paceibacterota bacterium]|nr:hypothetical protein [Candidatus Paceibacterota bacterium]
MKKIIIVVLTLALVFWGTTAYAQEYTVEDANREYQELRTNLQQYLNKNGIPLFYAKTENIFAVLAKQIIVSDTNGSYVGYIYQVVDVAMIKAVDFPFEMKGPAKYPIVIWKPILI